MTLEQIIAGLALKQARPVSGDAPGMAVKPSGWADAVSIANAEKLNINGVDYEVVAGALAPAEGKLTITANQIYLGAKPVSLSFGDKGVENVYMGTGLIYSKSGLSYTLWDAGQVGTIQWTVNTLPRPQYTTLAVFAIQEGRMFGYITERSTGYSHNGHFITRTAHTVPAAASVLKVTCNDNGNPGGKLRFGLLPADAPNSYSTANGGQLSSEYTLSGSGTYSLTLDSAVKGAENLLPIINLSGSTSTRKDIIVTKVWYE